MWIKRKVVMLPTNEKAPLVLHTNGTLYPFHENKIHLYDESCKNQHLYILSDDEIKESDWFIQENSVLRTCYDLEWKGFYKIIATTDSSLVKEGLDQDGFQTKWNKDYHLPQPSQSFIKKFIEEYNKGNIITDVMVEYEEWHVVKMPTDFMNHLDITKGLPIIDGTQRVELKLKVKDNTITIKKIKDSWSRDEVETTIINVFRDIYKDRNWESKAYDWINENL